ncbi:interferon gamma receptor 2-like [Onychostruthus taczanowskii]|uniref:interferon gamma receptor 2-like n=1 Tax=Onychostruthus taczanowskii TaxID=356909 RepID=UPI001B80CC44|nr:interferon gamma receptor 2-like [Onychostruthus taczanowskii]
MRGRAPLLLLLWLPLLLLGSARAAAAVPNFSVAHSRRQIPHCRQNTRLCSHLALQPKGLLFAVLCRRSYHNWSDMGCAQSPQTWCSFPPELRRRRRWTVELRVRAELGARASAWARSAAFVAQTNTTLGPPRVNNVSASPGSLLVSVSPPFSPEPGDLLQYLVSYWENSTSGIEKKLSESKTLFQIGNLKESTLYCFSVRVRLKIYSGHLLEGQQSAPECHRTALSEATRAGYIIPLFVLALVAVNLLVAALLCLWKKHQSIKHWAQPPLQIPAHFREFLRDPGPAAWEELCSPAEEEPQALVLGEGSGQEGEDPSANTSRGRAAAEGPPQ